GHALRRDMPLRRESDHPAQLRRALRLGVASGDIEADDAAFPFTEAVAIAIPAIANDVHHEVQIHEQQASRREKSLARTVRWGVSHQIAVVDNDKLGGRVRAM